MWFRSSNTVGWSPACCRDPGSAVGRNGAPLLPKVGRGRRHGVPLRPGLGGVTVVAAGLHHVRRPRAVHPPRQRGVWRLGNQVGGLALAGGDTMADRRHRFSLTTV